MSKLWIGVKHHLAKMVPIVLNKEETSNALVQMDGQGKFATFSKSRAKDQLPFKALAWPIYVGIMGPVSIQKTATNVSAGLDSKEVIARMK